MPLAPGTTLGPYEVIAPLGAGGMGEVYRARDKRLGREVAIKVLPQHLSQNPEIRARFEREAKTVSGLNHPHICVLYDVGREGDTDFLVMELVEGDTLAARLRRGALPGPELLRLATQVADALDRAHRAGVIHRDLKPANIMVTRSGAKLMDFGLSRVTGMAGSGGDSGRTLSALTQSPTMAQALTTEGTLLGTFQYMSPEQLEGREADVRSDIWALGCVLYEMATGRRAFEGRSQASLIAAILEREPPAVGEVPSGSVSQPTGAPPHGIERLIRNCLAKDPDERIQTAHDVKLHLQGIAEGAGLSSTSVASVANVTAVATRARASGSRFAWALATAGLLAAAGVFAWAWPRVHRPPPAFRFLIGAIPNTTEVFWPRVSPDGRYMLLQASDSTGASTAFVRPLDQIEAQPVPGTRGLQRAYWSPDGREIAFIAADDKLQRVPIAGGSPTTICAASGGADLSWGSRGLILMDGQNNDSLRVVPAGGGDLRPATRVDRAAGEVGSAWPCFLPDGKHFLFIGTLAGGGSNGNIRLGTIGSLDSKLLGKSDGRVEYAPGGWVLFLRGITLLAQKLDLGAGKLTGQPITLADRIRVGNSSGHFSVSGTGVLAFSRDFAMATSTLRVMDRSGAPRESPNITGPIASPSPSPDGHHLMYVSLSGGGTSGEAHVIDLDRSTDTRLTFTGDAVTTVAWSPDGRRIAYVTQGAGSQRIYLKSADGLGAPDSIALPLGMTANLRQWSDVGPRLVFNYQGRGWAVPSEGANRTPSHLGDSTQSMFTARMSPDGRWLAGGVAAGTVPQIFVQSLTGTPGRWQISTRGGSWPSWTRGGRELLYEGLDGQLMTVDIDTQAGFRPGTPRPMFTLPSRSFTGQLSSWGCDAQGERFYVLEPAKSSPGGSVEVISDFAALVHRK